jgi:hypothetical protein
MNLCASTPAICAVTSPRLASKLGSAPATPVANRQSNGSVSKRANARRYAGARTSNNVNRRTRNFGGCPRREAGSRAAWSPWPVQSAFDAFIKAGRTVGLRRAKEDCGSRPWPKNKQASPGTPAILSALEHQTPATAIGSALQLPEVPSQSRCCLSERQPIDERTHMRETRLLHGQAAGRVNGTHVAIV